MQKVYMVRLEQEERVQLQALIRKGKAAAYRLMHARVLRKADQGASWRRVTDQAVAAAVDVGPATVARDSPAVRRRRAGGGVVSRAPGTAVSPAPPRWEGRGPAGRGRL